LASSRNVYFPASRRIKISAARFIITGQRGSGKKV